MKLSDRLHVRIDVTGLPIWTKTGISRPLSPSSLTGAELVGLIADATAQRSAIDSAIWAMSRALDCGETTEERVARIATEDADPKAAAEARGWYAIEDFAELCDKSETGFYWRISGIKGQIVKPSQHSLEKMLRGTWNRYPSRAEFWGDHFKTADSWAEALRLSRVEEQRLSLRV